MPAVLNRCYDRMRHRSAQPVGNDQRTVQGFELARPKYCVLVTYRRSGAVGAKTPVRFGLKSAFAASGRSEGPAHPQRPASAHRHAPSAACRSMLSPRAAPRVLDRPTVRSAPKRRDRVITQRDEALHGHLRHAQTREDVP
jgi:hypothetical protein